MWIDDVNGNLVNLVNMASIKIVSSIVNDKDPIYEVRVKSQLDSHEYFVLASFTNREEAQQWLWSLPIPRVAYSR